MAEIIAFCGSPSSGKTSIALKTAMELYCSTKDEKVVFLSPDLNVPSIGLLFPNYNPDDVCTLSKVLDSTDISDESLLSNAVTVKSMKDFLCFGFKSGENQYSFPVITQDKLIALFNSLMDISGYIVVDCSSDEISQKALSMADTVVQILTPDLKGMTWFSSHKRLSDVNENIKFINVINITDKDLFYPVEEVSDKLKSVPVIIPYCRNLKQQMLDGSMYERLNDKNFNKKIRAIVERLLM